MYQHFLKPLLDSMVAILVLVVFAPILIVLITCLAIVNNGKPFFYQLRPGKDAKIFKIVKLKTMNDKVDAQGNLLPDAVRLTRVGKFVRKTSLDELPQLINVLKGDMSIVGPRPLLPEYLPLYNEFQKKRHLVKPGITGWAQVNGRNAISWTKKFELDVWYVTHQSFLLDIKILLKTIQKVVGSKDINTAGEATTTHFTGNTTV